MSGEQFEVVLGALFTVLGCNVHDSSPQQAAVEAPDSGVVIPLCLMNVGGSTAFLLVAACLRTWLFKLGGKVLLPLNFREIGGLEYLFLLQS